MSADKLETVEFDLMIRLRFTEVADVEQLRDEVTVIAGSIDWDCGDGNASWDGYQVDVSRARIVS